MTQTIRTIRIATQGPAGPQGPAGGVTSVVERTGAVMLTKSDVGLGNVSNADTSNAGNIASGTLADARLSSNVALKNASNTWSGANTFSNALTVQGGALAIQTTVGTAFGVNAGAAKRTDVTVSDDTFFGYHAGQSVPAGQTFHTLIGAYAGGTINTGAGVSEGVTAVGQKALTNATTANRTVAVGGKAGTNLTVAQTDVFVGYASAQFVTATNLGNRVYVGYSAGQYDAGDYNIYVGYTAGAQNASPNDNPTTGQKNIGIGGFTLNNLKGGIQNVAIGHQALNAVTSHFGNVAIGYQAGQNTAASANIFIGNNAGTINVTGSNNIYLGNNAGSTAPTNLSNTFISGNENDRIDNVYFGKGYASIAPVNYTIHGTHGSGSNVAGGSISIAGGQSTGSGVSGDVVLQTGGTGAGTTALNSLVAALTIKGATQRIVVGGASPFVAFGGQTASFPAFKQSSAVVQARLADDSGFAQVQGKLTAHANAVTETIVPDKTIILYDASGTAYRVPCLAV